MESTSFGTVTTTREPPEPKDHEHVFVKVPRAEYEKLMRIATEECRDVEQQVWYFVREALRVHDDPATGGDE